MALWFYMSIETDVIIVSIQSNMQKKRTSNKRFIRNLINYNAFSLFCWHNHRGCVCLLRFIYRIGKRKRLARALRRNIQANWKWKFNESKMRILGNPVRIGHVCVNTMRHNKSTIIYAVERLYHGQPERGYLGE